MEYPFSGFIPYDSTSDPITIKAKAINITKYMESVEAVFEIPEGTLALRHIKTGKPLKKWKEVSLSEIRKAAIYHLRANSDLGLCHIGDFFGEMHHSSVLYFEREATKLLLAEDAKFLYYYDIVRRVAV